MTMSKLTVDTTDLESQGLDFEDVILEGGNIEVGVGGGQDGRGIESIEQTTISTEDGGINIITQTLTDGTEATFQIRNGQRGLQGERGEKGDAGEDWIPTQQELASIASSAAALVDVPTKTSDLQNDSGFVTSNSPSFTGTPTAPTPASSAAADSYQIANVEFVIGEISARVSNKVGQPNGIASLDSNGKVPSSQLPSSGGGDTNVIEVVKVNGTALTPDANKAVDVIIPSWAMQSTKPTYTASEVGALPANTTIPSTLADLSADSTHRVVTDAEKATWNGKANAADIPTATSDLTNDSNFVVSTAITNVVYLTQSAYDALSTKDSNTLYVIPE